MRVKCISNCQTGNKTLYEAGKEYEIPTELYENNKDRFEAVKESKGGQK